MVSLKPLKTFAPTDVDTTVYPFNIERNVCGGDRLARVLGAFIAFTLGLKAVVARRPFVALVCFAATVGLSLNAIAGRCVVSAVLDVDTCD